MKNPIYRPITAEFCGNDINITPTVFEVFNCSCVAVNLREVEAVSTVRMDRKLDCGAAAHFPVPLFIGPLPDLRPSLVLDVSLGFLFISLSQPHFSQQIW